jgi:putative transposase
MTLRTHRKNINEPGHAHELTFSCYRRFPFLKSEQTCQWLAEAIENARSRECFSLWAYVFMPDHVHLLIYPHSSDYDMADIRKAIKKPVAERAIKYLVEHSPEWLPRITRQRGGRIERLFWQSGGGYDRNVTSPRVLLSVIDYLHMNPVRRGLVERAVEWKWSSAAWFLEAGSSPMTPDRIPADWL